MPMQDCQQEAQSLCVETLREPAWRLSLREIHERLNLHEHGPRALSRHECHAAGDGSCVPRQENRRRILDLAKTFLAHHEEAHLVRGAEPILDGADDAEAAADVA